METVGTFAAARGRSRGRVGVVPTMGFLHEGHLSLVKAARGACDTLVVTLFVNPLQFGPNEDYESYPRDLERDRGLLEAHDVDVLFAPSLEEMYPVEPKTRVVVGELDDSMEGLHRPGHLEGVATVVAKLFAGLRPDSAYFGRKDAQQLAVVGTMARDLSIPVEVVGCPIVREQDGLALSSRNVHLSADQRERGLGLSRALRAAAEAIVRGEREGARLERLVLDVARESDVVLEYCRLSDAAEVRHLASLERSAFLAVAADVDGTRLIDNLHAWVNEGGVVTPEFGIVLEGPSVLYQRS
ncbi:MAG TPA: pantoate--beta-alanine ligase [Acidimicrobiia bacterium]